MSKKSDFALTRLFIGVKSSFLFFLLSTLSSCDQNVVEKQSDRYATQNIIILVIDGPRYTDTWAGSSTSRIPYMNNLLRPHGTFFEHFYNDGVTMTNPGHTAILTGIRQSIDNSGFELPQKPTFMQYWLKASGKPGTSAWLVTSKGKLSVLANTANPEWKDQFQPSINCGVNGSNNGYREDSITFNKAKQVLKVYKPNLMLINLKEPDVAGHAGNWRAYLAGISASDKYAGQLWEFIQNDPFYKDRTALLITNDHGRHTEGFKDGFINHGDNCDGCQHISLLALGPDFPKGQVVSAPYNQTDISPTVAALLGFSFTQSQGQPIKELLEKE